MIRDYINQIKQGHNLDHDAIGTVMRLIIAGQVATDEIKDFLLSLNKKGPTVEEITACALMMRNFVIPVQTKHKVILDTCGTGGDGRDTFNISTVAAIVVAACGVAVAKHGNRRVSSRCGSADVLEELGVNVEMEEKHLSACLDSVGLAFLFAQRLHPAMKHVAPVRQALGVKTIFNILGPLTNPARATHQIMGLYSRDLVEPMAHVLKNLGLKRALVVHGNDGLDEITTTDKTFVSEFKAEEVISYDIDPDELGIQRVTLEDLAGGDVKTNADIVRDILGGKQGPRRDIVAVNAAYALYITGVASNLRQAIEKAQEAIDSKKALQKLEALKEFTNRVR